MIQKGHKTIHSLLSELYKPQKFPKYLDTDLRFLRKISNVTLWPKKWAGEKHSCWYSPWDSGRSGLISRQDWMLSFRTRCRASGYGNGGCQCQSRIHASKSTFPSGHSSSYSRSANKCVGTAGGSCLPGQPAGCSLPRLREKQPLEWNCSGDLHPLVPSGWP